MGGFVLLLSFFSGLYVLSSCLSRDFYFINMEKTWTDAQTYCRENYVDLATINNTQQLKNLVNSASSDYFGQAWIGLFDDVNSWQWSLSDSSFYSSGEANFRNWGSGEPDNLGGQEYCAAINSGGSWHSYSCEVPFAFICYAANGPKTYVIVGLVNSWAGAQSYCRQYYTDLVSVRTMAENDKIQQAIQANIVIPTTLWIGLFRDSWKWSDLKDSPFRNWRPGQPDNALLYEQCAAVDLMMLYSGAWEDKLCNLLLPFFCYKDFESTTAITTLGYDTSSGSSTTTSTSTTTNSNGNTTQSSKFPKRKVIRMELNTDVDLSDSALSDSILQQLRDELTKRGMPEDTSLQWRTQPDGHIFQMIEEEQSEKQCEMLVEDALK